MLLTDYLDTIENTQQEQQFMQHLAELKEHFVPATKIPFVGRMIRALVALGDCGSVTEFKQSEHYPNIRGYNITLMDLEKGYFSITPGREQLAKVIPILGTIVGLLLLWIVLRRRGCGCSE